MDTIKFEVSKKYRTSKIDNPNVYMEFVVCSIDEPNDEIYIKITNPVSSHTGIKLSSMNNPGNKIELINENKMNQPTIDILTFREWAENGVAISFNLHGAATIYSLQSKKVFKNVTNPVLVEELKDRPNPQLLPIYEEHFEWIQEQHQKWLKEFDQTT